MVFGLMDPVNARIGAVIEAKAPETHLRFYHRRNAHTVWYGKKRIYTYGRPKHGRV